MYTLYFAPDNASLVVRVVLQELALPYETVLVDRSQVEQRSEAYRRLNPRGLIPVLLMDGQPIHETAAIILALADRHGALAPGLDDPERAGFLRWLLFLSNGLHTDLRQCFYPDQYASSDAGAQAEFERLARDRVLADLDILEAAYGASPGPWLCGAELTVADIYLGFCLRWLQLYLHPSPLAPGRFVLLSRMLETLQSRPAVQRSCAAEGIASPCLLQPSYPDGSQGAAF